MSSTPLEHEIQKMDDNTDPWRFRFIIGTKTLRMNQAQEAGDQWQQNYPPVETGDAPSREKKLRVVFLFESFP